MIDERAAQVRCLAEELLGPVESVVHQPYGHSGLSFEIRSGREYILKTRVDPGAFDHTERHIDVLGNLGIPVPTVLKKDKTPGFEYMLLAKIPGRDLGFELGGMTSSQMSRLAAQVVDIERKVAALPKGKAFGWTPLNVPGPFPSWTAVIERDSRSCPDSIRNEIVKWNCVFDRVEATCFLDDLATAHRSRLTAGSICYGSGPGARIRGLGGRGALPADRARRALSPGGRLGRLASGGCE